MQLRTIELFRDPTPNGIINQRYLSRMTQLATLTDLQHEELEQLLNLLLLVSKKLVAVWNHSHRYIEIEDSLMEQAEASVPLDQQLKISYSQDLFLEFDEFLVQVKSTLDYLVRIPVPVIGRRWNLQTFGEKGGAVVKALRNNIPDQWKEKGAWMIETVINPHRPWLEASIYARDMINHCKDGGFRFEAFIVGKFIKDGEEYIHVPQMEDGMTIRTIIEITWLNLLSLVEDFTASFLGFRIRHEFVIFHGKSEPDSVSSPWNAMTRENFELMRQRDPSIRKV